MAAEILRKTGHSYEVDIWSIGCVMYTLLVGQPPFETKNLKDTYNKIKKCEYRVPTELKKNAADMICAMLQSNPEKRPKIGQLLHFDFIAKNAVPESLPSSCLTMEPRRDHIESMEQSRSARKPLIERNTMVSIKTKLESTFLKNYLHDAIMASAPAVPTKNHDTRTNIEKLYKQISNLISNKSSIKITSNLSDEYTDPAAKPLFWISKWVDFSNKCGFGYQLCDGGMGVMFNDTTKLFMPPNGINVHFIDKEGNETYMTRSDYPTELKEKMKWFTYFICYMTKYLLKTGPSADLEINPISRIPHVHIWFRTKCATVIYLTNGTIQFNFSDHVKIILCPKMEAVTYMDDYKKIFQTYRFSTILQYGLSKDLYQKIRYAHIKLQLLIEKLS